MTSTRSTIVALVALIALAFPSWAESAHPTPADPNNVHGHTDSGVGSGGLDNGVVKGPKLPKGIAVMPIADVPAPTSAACFTSWSAPAHGIGHGTYGNWATTENGCVLHASASSPRVAPWSRADLAPAQPASAVVLTNGWEHDDRTVAMAGTVSINGGAPVAVLGWRWGTALVVPIPAGTAVASVEYRATVVPGQDSSGVKLVYLWP